MDVIRRPRPGQLYRHFKNNIYQIIGIAKHSETEEEMVVYQALYGEFGLYVRPLEMFMEEVDHEKYPDILQRYRFELVTKNEEELPLQEKISDDKEQNTKQKELEEPYEEVTVHAEEIEESRINPYLLKFLDSESYQEKLQVFIEIEKHTNNRLMDDISHSLDFVIEEGTLKEKYDEIKNCIETRAKFETSRLR